MCSGDFNLHHLLLETLLLATGINISLLTLIYYWHLYLTTVAINTSANKLRRFTHKSKLPGAWILILKCFNALKVFPLGIHSTFPTHHHFGIRQCVAFQVDWVKGKSNFHPQHFKDWTDFQAFHNINISTWIPITLISLSMPLLRRPYSSQGIKTHADLYSGFVISYEAILTLQLPGK